MSLIFCKSCNALKLLRLLRNKRIQIVLTTIKLCVTEFRMSNKLLQSKDFLSQQRIAC